MKKLHYIRSINQGKLQGPTSQDSQPYRKALAKPYTWVVSDPQSVVDWIGIPIFV